MDRRIVGFHQDEEEHWVAQLECGHNQHVRHNPPWSSRAWVITPEGGASVLGEILLFANALPRRHDETKRSTSP